MSEELPDSLLERLGPTVLRVLALLAVVLLVTPLALLLAVPFFG
jgi:hypothetical protein